MVRMAFSPRLAAVDCNIRRPPRVGCDAEHEIGLSPACETEQDGFCRWDGPTRLRRGSASGRLLRPAPAVAEQDETAHCLWPEADTPTENVDRSAGSLVDHAADK